MSLGPVVLALTAMPLAISPASLVAMALLPALALAPRLASVAYRRPGDRSRVRLDWRLAARPVALVRRFTGHFRRHIGDAPERPRVVDLHSATVVVVVDKRVASEEVGVSSVGADSKEA
jgi:hypothetical protein